MAPQVLLTFFPGGGRSQARNRGPSPGGLTGRGREPAAFMAVQERDRAYLL